MGAASDLRSTNRGLLWIVALSLLTMAICLVLLVSRLLFHPPPRSLTATAPAEEPGDVIRERRAAFQNRPPRPVPPAPAPDSLPGANVQQISVVEPPATTAQPAPVIAQIPGFGGGGRVVRSNAPLTGTGATNYGTALVGTVLLRGTPPPETPIDLGNAPYCAGVPDPPLTTHDFVVDPNGRLADVLVHIRSGPVSQPLVVPPFTNRLQFTNCQLQPFISAMIAGQAILVQNCDATLHDLRVLPRKNPPGHFSLTNGAVASLLNFQKPELFVEARCALHPWERAYVSALDNPFFAVTDAEGRFTITNVPPGRYSLEALHRKTHGTNGITRTVTLRSGQTVTVDFTVEAPRIF